MVRVLRGDIYWADLNPVKGYEQAGIRPVVIISNHVFNDSSGTVIAMAITSQPQKAGFPLSYELKSGNLPKKSWVKISQARTISTLRLGDMIGQVDAVEIDILVEGLNEIISN